EVNVEVVSAEVYDEIAIVRSEQPVTVIAVADSTRTQAYFRELFVLRRTADGWRIHKYMFSQNPAQA
ncbi:nuclear transport factor 2 family protein, partial [Streptomyces bobili]|uniref:nuclear transport factor 2 family protein n=1 Tax=Streptomyces bobili TaxID=67280 RepID=UPI0033B2489C